ncbi:MAG: TIGR03943 family protein [Chloroflexota bacterium]
MSIRTYLKAGLILTLGIFAYSLIVRQTLAMYIHPRFTTLTLIASLGMVLVALSYFRPGQKDDQEHNPVTWIGLVVIALPLVMGFLVEPRPLGASAMQNREVNLDTMASIAVSRQSNVDVTIPSGEKNILDWLTDFQSNPDPYTFEGEEAQISGFIYRDAAFPEGTFMVSRFVVSCCTADGSPVGLVAYSEGFSDTLDSDQWIDVKGEFEIQTFMGREIPVLRIDELELIEAPKQPYLYP